MYDTFLENSYIVTISLEEYRDLVTYKATAEYQMIALEKRINEVENQNRELINEVMLLQEAFDEESNDES